MTSSVSPHPSHEIHTQFGAIADEWEALAARTAAPPFLYPGWFEAWWRAFGRGSLEILAVRRAGDLIGVLPMARRRGVAFSLTNIHTPFFRSLAEDDDAHAALVRQMARLDGRRVQVSFVDGASGLAVSAPSAFEEAGRRVVRRVVQQSPVVAIDSPWEEYLQRLPGARRSEVRRRRRRMEERGDVQLDLGGVAASVDERLGEAFAIELRSWKGAAGSAIGSRPETEQFYREISHWAASRGWLCVAFLRFDGVAVAFDLSIECGGVHYLLKTSFDPAFAELSPGVVLRLEMIQRAFAERLARYEFLGNNEPYKRMWTEEVRDLVLVQAFDRDVAGSVDWMAFAHGRPAAKRLLERRRR